ANPKFAEASVVLIVGANDVVNPAANTAEGTPIYGMPILDVTPAPSIIICNLNTDPGYAGVNNPLFDDEKVMLLLGDAAVKIGELVAALVTDSE
ncbi:MAG: NAD(P)(+) transhydrogenase (Re/Si-specific) subunit beta, partial [Lentisphaerae bacterium]|nr:NAD(P)(+) transhydrogenase (Re/Si-specific) subunit beta [Lentisphaerota bacterium]